MYKEGCIFCDIVSGKIPADIVISGQRCIGIRDIHPQAPEHVLFIPREHIEKIRALSSEHLLALGEIFQLISAYMEGQAYDKRGYRVVFNEGPDAGRSIDHIHFHVLAGRPLAWPPG